MKGLVGKGVLIAQDRQGVVTHFPKSRMAHLSLFLIHSGKMTHLRETKAAWQCPLDALG
jgi:hypothetical protein